MRKKLNWQAALLAVATTIVLILTSCATPTPEVIEKIVTQVVQETVKETVIVEGTPQVIEKEVTKIVEKEVPAEKEQVLRIITGSSGSASFNFDGLRMGSDFHNWKPMLFVPPLYFDKDLKLQPGTFESWESNDDSTVWTFKIDARAKWSDGSPITATDFKLSWEACIDPNTPTGRVRGYLGNVEGFADAQVEGGPHDVPGLKVLDDRTIQVTLVNPDPALHWRIATTHMNPVKAEQYATYGWDEFWLPENNPVYSGPFIMTQYDPDLQTATFEPNPHWWMDEGPYLDKITFIFVTDQQTMAAMLLNDQADATLAMLGPEMVDRLPDMFRTIKSFGFNVFWLDQAAEPTNDPNVRKALALSVDWDAVFEATFLMGTGKPTKQIIDPDLPCKVEDASWYEYDPEAAKAALAASSYGSAENLPKLRVTPRGSDVYNNRALEAAMEFWRDNLGITNLEFKQAPDEFGEENIDLINLSRDDVVIRFPDSAFYMWTAAHSTGPVASGGLLGAYVNPEIDAYLDEALTLSPDDPRRCELALKAQELFMNDYLVLPFGKRVASINARDYVKNYFKGPDVGVIEPWKIKIER
jgi:peptide/nickel transport system substrate-binding protein